jgi:hypothetical protein
MFESEIPRTKKEIPRTKKTNVYFLGEERENKKKTHR